jgi:hypothetical protein
MLGKRALISFSQLLALQPKDEIVILFNKHDIANDADYYLAHQRMQFVTDAFRNATPQQIQDVLAEFVRLRDVYRYNVTPRHLHDQRCHEMEVCLLLDGYSIVDGVVRAADPTVEAFAPIEDDLTAALEASGLRSAQEMVRLMSNSADRFRANPPDYNASLTSARIALETLAREVATERRARHGGNFDPAKWGQVIAYLRTSGLITDREELGLTGVYSFISEGAHAPVGMTEQEMVRFGRNLAASTSYFLIKRYLG